MTRGVAACDAVVSDARFAAVNVRFATVKRGAVTGTRQTEHTSFVAAKRGGVRLFWVRLSL